MGLMASLCNICVCVCVLCALCPVLCAVCCVLWGAVEINKNRILMVFCSFLATKKRNNTKTKDKNKKRKQKKGTKKRKEKFGCGGGGGLFVCVFFLLCAKAFFWRGVVCLIHNLVLCSNLWQHFSFEQPFPPAANVEEHCWLAMQLGANTCPPSIWWGTQPPIRMKMDSNCAQLHG